MYREKANNYIFMYIYVFFGGEDRDVSREGSVNINCLKFLCSFDCSISDHPCVCSVASMVSPN